jgi:hypothetical protein
MKRNSRKKLVFLERNRPIVWTPLEYETELLEKAESKIFKPTIAFCNGIASGGEFIVTLSYKKRISEELETKEYPLSIFNEKGIIGLPFKITLPKSLDIPGVLYKDSYGLTNELTLTRDGKKYYTEQDSVKDFRTVFPRKPQILEGVFTNFKSSNNPFPISFFRLVIQVKDTDMIYPTSILESHNHMKFDYPNWERQSSLMGIPFFTTKGMFSELIINENKFHFYGLEPIKAFIIDSLYKLSIDEFIKYTYAIRLCFAFLSGKFYRDEVVFLASGNADFSTIDNFDYRVESPSVITNNQIINPNFFFDQYRQKKKSSKENWKQHHNMFSTKNFSSLCEKVLESPELMRSIELIVNAGNTNDPIQKGALYSVSIETITEYFKSKNESAFKPISDKRTWRKFLKLAKESLEEIKPEIDEMGYKILNSKIENLNSSTNRDKLIKPFELHGIILTEDELSTLEHRNSYLHGGQPKDIKWKTEMDIIALKLHSLVGMLLLKSIGYSGHFIHLPAWHILHDREAKSIMEKMNFEVFKKVYEKVKNQEIKNLEELDRAKEVLENAERFFKSASEIENIIRII